MVTSGKAVIFHATQWVKVPWGASGSSTINTRLLALAGIILTDKGGLIFFPSQVYCTGIVSLFLKAGLVTIKVAVVAGVFIIRFCELIPALCRKAKSWLPAIKRNS